MRNYDHFNWNFGSYTGNVQIQTTNDLTYDIVVTIKGEIYGLNASEIPDYQAAREIAKLVGTIDWSWVWVLSPAWISILLAGLAGGVLEVLKTIIDKRSTKRLEEYRKNKFNTKK